MFPFNSTPQPEDTLGDGPWHVQLKNNDLTDDLMDILPATPQIDDFSDNITADIFPTPLSMITTPILSLEYTFEDTIPPFQNDQQDFFLKTEDMFNSPPMKIQRVNAPQLTAPIPLPLPSADLVHEITGKELPITERNVKEEDVHEVEDEETEEEEEEMEDNFKLVHPERRRITFTYPKILSSPEEEINDEKVFEIDSDGYEVPLVAEKKNEVQKEKKKKLYGSKKRRYVKKKRRTPPYCGPRDLQKEFDEEIFPQAVWERKIEELKPRRAIGAYTPVERWRRIREYAEKRSAREYGKKIRYNVRKSIAQKRKRIDGRFVTTQTTVRA
ncbi:hypothetical protein PCE1_004421 [Barthelona sp. PCE]